MNRRRFLLGTVASFTYMACGGETDRGFPPPDGASADDEKDATAPAVGVTIPPTSAAERSHVVFPQGLASGDPRPDRVILWCRIDPVAAGKLATDDLDLDVIVARDEQLTDVVLRRTVRALAADDHTVRVVPTTLEPGRFYYYRFGIAAATTQVGRTRTSPRPDDAVPVRFAMCACQDYIGRRYHSWKALLGENEVDFVLFLGDYIYESVGDKRFQSPSPDREIQLPDGLDTSPEQDGSRIAAGTLKDYRALYRAYRSDPLLREVHRRFPFIITWDDHEFADDCWGDHSTSFDELSPITKKHTSEQNTPRRLAANRAFSEYQPAEVVYDAAAPFPLDLRIYRTLQWGKYVDLFMTDQRTYRDDHLIPEGPVDLTVGKFTKNSSVGSRYFVKKAQFDEREAAAKPTLLGSTQKAWLVDAVLSSKATWKVWGNQVQMYQMALRLGELPRVPDAISYTAYINADQWDGFRSERSEILEQFRAAKVENLVVCTGDIHAFFASELHVDFDAPDSDPVGVEFVTAGISSASLGVLVQQTIPPTSPLHNVAEAWVEGADKALLSTNPHLRFADSNAYGFTIVDVTADAFDVTFVQVSDPQSPNGGVIDRTQLRTYSKTNRIEIV